MNRRSRAYQLAAEPESAANIAFDGKATLREVNISFGPPGTPSIHLLLVVPNKRKGPIPVFVGTNFGPGSLTRSGYPRLVKLWKRGTPLEKAELVYEGKPTDVAVGAVRDLTRGYERDFVHRGVTFWTDELFLRKGGKLTKIDKPDDAQASAHRDRLFITLRSDWKVGGKTYPAGALLATLYGALVSNMFCLPIADKLHGKLLDEETNRTLIIDGILMIRDSKSPALVREMLLAYLPEKHRHAEGETVPA